MGFQSSVNQLLGTASAVATAGKVIKEQQNANELKALETAEQLNVEHKKTEEQLKSIEKEDVELDAQVQGIEQANEELEEEKDAYYDKHKDNFNGGRQNHYDALSKRQMVNLEAKRRLEEARQGIIEQRESVLKTQEFIQRKGALLNKATKGKLGEYLDVKGGK